MLNPKNKLGNKNPNILSLSAKDTKTKALSTSVNASNIA